jgi:hypothetical protein
MNDRVIALIFFVAGIAVLFGDKLWKYLSAPGPKEENKPPDSGPDQPTA